MTRLGGDRSADGHGNARPSTDEAFARLNARLTDLGITRLADITGLDRIGIPVVQAIRPTGLANTVTQGKGPDLATAAVSAIMEAAEQAFSERLVGQHGVLASAHALGVEPSLYAHHRDPAATPDWAGTDTAWIAARDLLSGRESWVPRELVHTAYVEPPEPTDGLFFASTTGLACAFDEGAALLHGVLECIERDAIARAHRMHGFFQRCRLDEGTIPHETLRELLDQVRNAGCTAAFFQAPAAGRMAVVWCQIMELERTEPILPFPADGFAAHVDLCEAAVTALREAAQSRLAAISGARDDVIQTTPGQRGDWMADHRRLLATGPRPLSFQADREHAERHASLRGLLTALSRHDGISSVLAVRLDAGPCTEIVATRVVVPELMPFA